MTPAHPLHYEYLLDLLKMVTVGEDFRRTGRKYRGKNSTKRDAEIRNLVIISKMLFPTPQLCSKICETVYALTSYSRCVPFWFHGQGFYILSDFSQVPYRGSTQVPYIGSTQVPYAASMPKFTWNAYHIVIFIAYTVLDIYVDHLYWNSQIKYDKEIYT